MAPDDIEREALLLSTSERARLAQKLLVSLESQSLLSDTWSQAWTEWVAENIPDPDPEPEEPRTLHHEMHDLINQQAILDRGQVQSLLDKWFEELPYLVLSNYDNLEHTSWADPHGHVLMHPIVAVTNGVVTIEQALQRGVWKDFDEFSDMNQAWSD